MNTLKELILNIKETEPTWGFKRIAAHVGCAPNTVKYHLMDSAKDASRVRVNRSRKKNPLRTKLSHFGVEVKWHMRVKQMNSKSTVKVTLEELTQKIGADPICYLTGRKINLLDSRSYHLDHKIPRCKGGDNSLDNLEIASREANQAKNDMSLEEFFAFCKEVLEHNGFTVTK